MLLNEEADSTLLHPPLVINSCIPCSRYWRKKCFGRVM